MWLGLFFVYFDTVYGFYGYPFFMLSWMFQHDLITWTPTVLSVLLLYVCVSYFCICTCSVQLSMSHMERRSRNMLIIIIIAKYSCLFTEGLNDNSRMICVTDIFRTHR